jgi:DNA replication protein DnaC
MSDEPLCGRIDARLRALHLPGALQRYRELAEASGAPEAVLPFLEACLQAEWESRELHRYERNLRAARFPVVKELSGFDFTVLPSLAKARVDELASGRFIPAHETVLLVGNSGTGKHARIR